jgi:hypothetical protein
MTLYKQTRQTKLYGISNLHTWTMYIIENNHKHFDMDYDMSNVVRDYHRLFEMEYDMSHVIVIDMKVDYGICLFICCL